MKHLIAAEDFPDALIEAGKRLRIGLDIPADLDSTFFIPRFLRACNGDEKVATQHIREYLNHRKIVGYGELDQVDVFTKHSIGEETYERFTISLVDQKTTSNNVHVFVQKMKDTDLKEIVRVIPLSHVLHSYYALQDVFGRVVAQTERETGKPSSVVCILDLKGLCLSDFLNPLSAPTKLARLVVKVWADYFSENRQRPEVTHRNFNVKFLNQNLGNNDLCVDQGRCTRNCKKYFEGVTTKNLLQRVLRDRMMCKLLLINPPGIVSLMWQVTRYIIDSKTEARIAFLANTDELRNHLEPQAIPKEYGGEWEEQSDYATEPDGCCRLLKPVLHEDYKPDNYIWRKNGYSKFPESKTIAIKGNKTVEHVIKSDFGGLLIWSFTVSGDVEFEVIKKEQGSELQLWPKITLTSLKLPEYGSVKVTEGDVILRFVNPSSTWLPVKVHLQTDINKQ